MSHIAMSSAASAPVSAPSGPSFTHVCSSVSSSTAWSSGSLPISAGARSWFTIPSDASPPCIGDAVDPIIGEYAHKGTALRGLVVGRPGHLEGVDAGDLHVVLLPVFNLQSTPADPTAK